MRLYWSRMGSESRMISVLIRRTNLDTDMHTGRRPCKHDRRVHGDAFTGKETPDFQEPMKSEESNMEQVLP
jgi:hypothetical protein